MIQVKMTSPNGVTLATNGKYVPDNIKITPVLDAKTVTPTDTKQIIVPNDGSVGLSSVTVEAAPPGIDTSDATAGPADIVAPKTAYVDGEMVTGINPYAKAATDAEVDEQADILSQMQAALVGKVAGNVTVLPLTQDEYDALETKDADTLYCIVVEVSA